MPSTLLAPLKKHLNRLIPEAINVQQQMEILVKAIDQTSTQDADQLEDDFVEFAETLITFLQKVRRIGSYGREISEMTNIPDRMADIMLVLEGIDLASDVDYIKLARNIEKIHEADVMRNAVKELTTYEFGPERLEWLKAALKDISDG